MEKEDKETLVKNYKNAKLTRDKIADILNKEIERTSLEEENPKKLRSINYQLELADSFGYKRALRECIKLLTQQL